MENRIQRRVPLLGISLSYDFNFLKMVYSPMLSHSFWVCKCVCRFLLWFFLHKFPFFSSVSMCVRSFLSLNRLSFQLIFMQAGPFFPNGITNIDIPVHSIRVRFKASFTSVDVRLCRITTVRTIFFALSTSISMNKRWRYEERDGEHLSRFPSSSWWSSFGIIAFLSIFYIFIRGLLRVVIVCCLGHLNRCVSLFFISNTTLTHKQSFKYANMKIQNNISCWIAEHTVFCIYALQSLFEKFEKHL